MKEKNKDILIAVLESILNIKIKEIKFLNLEKNNGNVYVRRKHFDLHVKTDKENIHIEVNNYLEDYVRPRNMAFICNTYSREVLRGEEYDENIDFIQINLTYNMINKYKEKNKFHDDKPLRIYEFRDETGKKYVNNFIIYEYNMDYYLNLWYSKNEELIEKYKYLIMLDLKPNELNILSKKEENSLKSQYKREGLEEGIEQGIEQGTRLAKLEDAKNLKQNGVDIEIISKSTGLTIEEINKL